MDRDLDLAVFEYAPGAVLVKDKKKHRVVGFGNLTDPKYRGELSKGYVQSPIGVNQNLRSHLPYMWFGLSKH